MFRIKKGLDLPILGAPSQIIGESSVVTRVALLRPDYIDLKPTMQIAVGDRVKTGQVLFTDKKHPAVRFTAPGAGEIVAIDRGAKRALMSVVVELDGDDCEAFQTFDEGELAQLDRATVQEQLLASGLWTAFRVRPFSKIPEPDMTPHSIFITAMDSNPLSADPTVIIAERSQEFEAGLKVVGRLTDGPLHLCKAANAAVPAPGGGRLQVAEFSGPHPSGLVGTHIHFVDPVGKRRSVWHLGYQDVIAIGHQFLTGCLLTERIVSLAGPMVHKPRLVRTRMGADLDQLTAGELSKGEHRIISGSVFSGHIADGAKAFLGRYHNQVSVLLEYREKDFFGWMLLGKKQFSASRAYAGHLSRDRLFPLTTSTNGSPRAMVPIGIYEQVMPLDILPTMLLRALIVEDTDQAQDLGCLELDEEDLALCTFVCPGKHEFGPMLRHNLSRIEKEG